MEEGAARPRPRGTRMTAIVSPAEKVKQFPASPGVYLMKDAGHRSLHRQSEKLTQSRRPLLHQSRGRGQARDLVKLIADVDYRRKRMNANLLKAATQRCAARVSMSNCTDYQARRLGVRYKTPGQKGTRFVHTLNGTAVAVTRATCGAREWTTGGRFGDRAGGIAAVAGQRPHRASEVSLVRRASRIWSNPR